MVAVYAFTVGALMHYTLFYRARLVPRWLSGRGLAAGLLMMTAGMLSTTPGTNDSTVVGRRLARRAVTVGC